MGAIKPQPQLHSIAVIKEGSSCKITPGDVLARRIDAISFNNMTDGKITVMFPDDNLFGKPVFSIDSRRAEQIPVRNNAELKVYTYTVYCDSIQDFAHASIPRIIIYDDMI